MLYIATRTIRILLLAVTIGLSAWLGLANAPSAFGQPVVPATPIPFPTRFAERGPLPLPGLAVDQLPSVDRQTISVTANRLRGEQVFEIRPGDEVWIVSARGCVGAPCQLNNLTVQRSSRGKFVDSSLGALVDSHRSDLTKTTAVYVHGNQTNYKYGLLRGMQIYSNLFMKSKCDSTPVRWVLWLWKSERELKNLYNDYLVKSQRSLEMGKTLSRMLQSFGDRRIVLMGFSLGAQVILASLDDLEQVTAEPTCVNDKLQIALVAPAVDPSYACGAVVRQVESHVVQQTAIFINRGDRAVKALRIVVRRECPRANGTFSELVEDDHLPLGPARIFDVSDEVPCKHSVERYTRSNIVKTELNQIMIRVAAATTQHAFR